MKVIKRTKKQNVCLCASNNDQTLTPFLLLLPKRQQYEKERYIHCCSVFSVFWQREAQLLTDSVAELQP